MRSCSQEGTRGLGAPWERIGRVFTGTPVSPLQAQSQSMALLCPSISSRPLCGSDDRAQGRGPKCWAKQEPGWCHQGRSGRELEAGLEGIACRGDGAQFLGTQASPMLTQLLISKTRQKSRHLCEIS